MQLIMDAEPSMDIADKMSTIEEPLDTNLKDTIESLKSDIGNKENIETKKNILENTADTVNGEDTICKEETTPTEVSADSDKCDEQNGNGDIKTENNVKLNNICGKTNGNGNHVPNELEKDNGICEDTSVSETNDDKSPDLSIAAEEAKVEEKSHDGNSLVENNLEDINIIQEDKVETNINKVENNLDNQSDKSLDNVDDNLVEEVIEKTILSNEETIDMDTDCLKSNSNEIISEVVSEGNDGPEIDTSIRQADNSKAKSDVTLEDGRHEDVEIMEMCTEEIEEVVSEKVTEKDVEILSAEVGIEKSDERTKAAIPEDEETVQNDSVSKTLEILETDTTATVAVDKSNVLNTVSDEIENGLNKDAVKDKSHNVEKPINETDTVIPQNDEAADVHHETNSAESVKNCETVPEKEYAPIETEDKEKILDVDEFIKDTDEVVNEASEEQKSQDAEQSAKVVESKIAPICKLSNTLDILSDDDEDSPQPEPHKKPVTDTTAVPTEKQCISIEDDDDIMLIDDTDSLLPSKNDKEEKKSEPVQPMETDVNKEDKETPDECTIDLENSVTNSKDEKAAETVPDVPKDCPKPETPEAKTEGESQEVTTEIKPDEEKEKPKEEPKQPLVAENFLSGYKKNLADMTRDDLEEFCILKIVEGIVDRSNLSDIKSKLKTMAQNIEEYKKKAITLTKQNRDLQLVLKSVQEEQKKNAGTVITPLKITRSVGMQVLMTDKPNMRKKSLTNTVVNNVNSNVNSKPVNSRTSNQSPRQQKAAANQQIPVPRLVPANAGAKTPSAPSANAANTPKNTNQGLNGMKTNTPQKAAEKRTHNRTQSVTVDLTDDEPPAKVTPKSSPAPPVRLHSPQNLMRPQFAPGLNSPRKVYIPISGPQGQNIRPGQTIMLKSVPAGPRIRGPGPHAASRNVVRMPRTQNNRHPAPLPECMKQYQPPNWKKLPPAPDLKLSKVENGIVISWKIEGYQENDCEEIASYQLYAYQETTSPASTALWKKIGDVKALPLPMACTLTQFMAGFKYYFAVRAVDVRSRLGPFSLPGSILLLNKM